MGMGGTLVCRRVSVFLPVAATLGQLCVRHSVAALLQSLALLRADLSDRVTSGLATSHFSHVIHSGVSDVPLQPEPAVQLPLRLQWAGIRHRRN